MFFFFYFLEKLYKVIGDDGLCVAFLITDINVYREFQKQTILSLFVYIRFQLLTFFFSTTRALYIHLNIQFFKR